MNIKRGDIYYADLSPVVGSEQGGIRPVLIVQNDVGNKYSPTVIAAAITSQKYKTKLPTHISVDAVDCGLQKDSIVLLEQVRTLDKKRLKERMGNLPTDEEQGKQGSFRKLRARTNDALSKKKVILRRNAGNHLVLNACYAEFNKKRRFSL